MAKSESASGGVTVTGVLGIVFVVLKLCGLIDWSWWWVTLPFWIAPFSVLLVLAIGIPAVLILKAMDRLRKS